MKKKQQLKAFTLIEIFVVLTIISILTLLVVTNVKSGKDTAKAKAESINSQLTIVKKELDEINLDSSK